MVAPLIVGAAVSIGKYLMENGLPLIANAVMAKGKEVVEEKLGVKLEPNMSPEQLMALKQKEFDHQEFLIKAAQEDFKTEVADKDSARKRDMVIIQSGKRNVRAETMYVLAVIVVGILVWQVLKSNELDDYAKGIITLVLGRFLGYLDNIYNFEFGTTRQSRAKDDTIEKLSKP